MGADFNCVFAVRNPFDHILISHLLETVASSMDMVSRNSRFSPLIPTRRGDAPFRSCLSETNVFLIGTDIRNAPIGHDVGVKLTCLILQTGVGVVPHDGVTEFHDFLQ